MHSLSTATVAFFALALTPVMSSEKTTPLRVGDPAPSLEAMDHRGNSFSLQDAYNKGLVLVYFYPKADTPGCTSQACSLRDSYEALREKGVEVIGVSMDTVSAQADFADKYHLPFTLIADTEGNLVDAFGVPRNRRGKEFFPARQAFLIRDGKIIWRDLSASTAEQAADVLGILNDLG